MTVSTFKGNKEMNSVVFDRPKKSKKDQELSTKGHSLIVNKKGSTI